MYNNSDKKQNQGKRAVIYVRYSTTHQKAESAEAQIKICEEWAAKNGVQVIYIYKDLGFTGTSTEKRNEFNKMIKDSEKGMFDLILVHKIDRFSRSIEDFYSNKKRLNDNGVDIIAVDSPLNDHPLSSVMESLLISMAEIFSNNLSNELQVKMKEHSLSGKYLGGSIPFGFELSTTEDEITGKVHKRLVVNEVEANTVKYIFELYKNGFGMGRIMSILKSEGYRTRNGKNFSRNAIKRILRDMKYIGYYTYGMNTSRPEKRKDPNFSPVLIENYYPRIVEKDVWDAVQEIVNSNVKISKSRVAKNTYNLTGLIKCKCCGKSFSGVSTQNYSYYKCNSKRSQIDACDNTLIRKDTLESLLLDYIKKEIFSDEVIDIIIDKVINNIKNDDKSSVNLKKELIKEKKRLEIKKERLLDTFLDGKIDKDRYYKKDKEVDSVLNNIETQLYEIEISTTEIKEDDIRNHIINFRDNLDAQSDKDISILFHQAINQIVIGLDTIDIYFNIFNPYHDGAGYNNNPILYNEDTSLAVATLDKINATLYRYDNGVIALHKQAKR